MDTREYKPLTIPLVSWNQKTLSGIHGDLIAQPLAAGFGVTLGNALRRVLLGGIEGAAVTSVIINGVNNEFSPLSGVAEDVMQLILNIKKLVIRTNNGKPGKMTLRKEGQGVVRASDIVADDHLEIVNGEHVLANVSPNGLLEVEFFVESGHGYQAAQWPDKQLAPDHRIYIDAMFSPVQRVSFDVEKTRVGGDIDYDKLLLTIDTNGAQTPLSVMHYAVSVLRTQLEHFLTNAEIPFNQLSSAPPQPVVIEHSKAAETNLKGIVLDFLFKPIDELELSVRANNCLLHADIKRIIDLVNLTEDEALKIKNFGRKSLNEVKESLAALDLSFGMNLKEAELKKMLKDSEDKG